MSFPRYPRYKDSGVNEIGSLPEHWDVKPLKHVAEIDSCGCYGVESEEGEHVMPVATTAQIDADGRFVVQDMPMRGFTTAEIQRYSCGDGDILVVKSSGSATNVISGKAGLVMKDTPPFVFSNFLMRIQPTTNVVDSRFIYSLLRSQLTRQRVEQMCSTTTYPNLSVSEYTSASLPIPPVAEQGLIATFLDRETARIDVMVAEQRRLINLLKEKRQAVISHAVTKGLNPHVPMKPSGIEWLGDMPEHWDMQRLGWICTDINDINHEMPEAVDDGVLFLSAKDLLDDGTLNFETDVKMISEEDYERLSQKIRPRRGDIIYSRIGAALGKARLVGTDVKFSVSYSCCVVRVRSEVACRHFVRVLLDGEMILTEARMRTKGIGVPDLGLGEIARFPIPLPPIAEQRAIVAFLEHETKLLTALTVEAERGIELLEEHRTALISAAVTGKIDVRGLVGTEAA